MTYNEQDCLIQNPNFHRNPRRLGILLLLMSQFFERLAYYGLIANLLYSLNANPFAWSMYNAAGLILIFNSISYFFSPVGAWLADVHLGKFKVMVIGYAFYTLFYVPLPFLYWGARNGNVASSVPAFCFIQRHTNTTVNVNSSDRPFWSERCGVILFVCLTMVAVAAAFIKAVITPFGAEQVMSAHPHEMRSFFNWYYWIINAGTLLAYLILAYIQVNVNMFWGYLASYIMLLLSGMIFLLARRFLFVTSGDGQFLSNVCGVLCYSSQCCCCCCRNRRSPTTVSNQQRLESSNEYFSDTVEFSRHSHCVRPRCLDRSKRIEGGPYEPAIVEDVKALLHILLIFVVYSFYWAGYYQMETSFLSQGLHMRVPFLVHRNVGPSIPVSWLALFDIVGIVILIPVLDKFIYPCFIRLKCMPNLYCRMAIGMALTVFAMVSAGIVERKRMLTFWGENNTSPNQPKHVFNQTIGNTTYFAADMTIFYQIPQYILVSVGEAFTSVAGLEFAYVMAPRQMQSLVTACFWMSAGFGSLFGVGLVQALQGTYLFSNDYYDINYRQPCPTDPSRWCRETRLDLYFFILAGIQSFGLLLFGVIVGRVLPYCGARPVPVHYNQIEIEAGAEQEEQRRRRRATRQSTSSRLRVAINNLFSNF